VAAQPECECQAFVSAKRRENVGSRVRIPVRSVNFSMSYSMEGEEEGEEREKNSKASKKQRRQNVGNGDKR